MDGSVRASLGPAVVRAEDVSADHRQDGCVVRWVCDPGPDGMSLGRRLVDLPAGSRLTGQAGRVGELMYVISGTGHITGNTADGRSTDAMAVGPDHGIWLPAGWQYLLAAQSELRLDVVTLPLSSGAEPAAELIDPGDTQPLVRNLYDCAVETTGDRQFRVLFGPGAGCHIATQFVGHIPPGRAPDHRHPYDEVVLVLDGTGVMHLDGGQHEIHPGTCTHLRPGQSHCLENTGEAMLRVLGVFHPADSPASKS